MLTVPSWGHLIVNVLKAPRSHLPLKDKRERDEIRIDTSELLCTSLQQVTLRQLTPALPSGPLLRENENERAEVLEARFHPIYRVAIIHPRHVEPKNNDQRRQLKINPFTFQQR